MSKKLKYLYVIQINNVGLEQHVFDTEKELKEFLLDQMANLSLDDFDSYLEEVFFLKHSLLLLNTKQNILWS
jgi:hypothetical protein